MLIFFFLIIRLPPRSTLFPYTTLFRSLSFSIRNVTCRPLLGLSEVPYDCRFEFNHRSEEHTSELQSRFDLVCRLLLEKKKIRLSPLRRGLAIDSTVDFFTFYFSHLQVY